MTEQEKTALDLLTVAIRMNNKNVPLKNGYEKLLAFIQSDKSKPCKLTDRNVEELDRVLSTNGINLVNLLHTKMCIRTIALANTPMTLVNPAMEAYKEVFGNQNPPPQPEQPEAIVRPTINIVAESMRKCTAIIKKFKDQPEKNAWILGFARDIKDRINKYGDKTLLSERQIAILDKYTTDITKP